MFEAFSIEIKISIIMPVYNVEKYLTECLESIKKQYYRNFELIIIDDGSTDNSGKICDEFSQNNPFARVIHIENGGVSLARNRGLDEAKGEFIVFVDPDDVLSKMYLKTLVSLMAESGNMMGLISYESDDINHLNNSDLTMNSRLLDSNYIFENIIRDNEIGGYLWNKIFNRSIIENKKLRFLKEAVIWEDLYFVIQYLSEIDNIAFCNEKLYYYRQRESSAIANMNLDKMHSKVCVSKKIYEFDLVGCERFHQDAKEKYIRTYMDYCWMAVKQRKLKLEEKKDFNKELRGIGKKDFFSYKDYVKVWLICLFG